MAFEKPAPALMREDVKRAGPSCPLVLADLAMIPATIVDKGNITQQPYADVVDVEARGWYLAVARGGEEVGPSQLGTVGRNDPDETGCQTAAKGTRIGVGQCLVLRPQQLLKASRQGGLRGETEW